MSHQAAIPQHDWISETVMTGDGLMAQVSFCTTISAKDHDPTTLSQRQTHPSLKPTPTTETAAAAHLTVRTSNYHFTTSAISRRYKLPFSFSHISKTHNVPTDNMIYLAVGVAVGAVCAIGVVVVVLVVIKWRQR